MSRGRSESGVRSRIENSISILNIDGRISYHRAIPERESQAASNEINKGLNGDVTGGARRPSKLAAAGGRPGGEYEPRASCRQRQHGAASETAVRGLRSRQLRRKEIALSAALISSRRRTLSRHLGLNRPVLTSAWRRRQQIIEIADAWRGVFVLRALQNGRRHLTERMVEIINHKGGGGRISSIKLAE